MSRREPPRPEQMTLFDLLPDTYQTPQLPEKGMQKGVKAWIVEARGVKHSMDESAPIAEWEVRARRVEFCRDCRFEKERGKWSAAADSCDGLSYMGWAGFVKYPTFTAKPRFGDMEKYVQQLRDYIPGTPIVPWIQRW